MKLEEMVRDIVSGAVDEYLKEETGSVSPAVCSSSVPVEGFPVPAEASGRHVHLSLEVWSTCSGRGMN